MSKAETFKEFLVQYRCWRWSYKTVLQHSIYNQRLNNCHSAYRLHSSYHEKLPFIEVIYCLAAGFSNYDAAKTLVRVSRPTLITGYTRLLQHHIMKVLCMYCLVLVNWNLRCENVGKGTRKRGEHSLVLIPVFLGVSYRWKIPVQNTLAARTFVAGTVTIM